MTEISQKAFYGSGLTTVTIPNNVTEIGANAFGDCKQLGVVNIGTGITRITGFDGCTSLSSITLPENIKVIGAAAFSKTALTSIVIPDSVTKIDSYAFENCTALEQVTIG